MKDSVQKLIFLLCSVHAVNQDKCGMFLFSVQATEPQTLRTSNVLWLRREETQRERESTAMSYLLSRPWERYVKMLQIHELADA